MLVLMTLWNFYIFNLVFNWFEDQTNFIEWIQLIWIIYVVNSFKFIFFQFKSIFQGSLRFLYSFIIMIRLNVWTLDLMICIFIILFIFLFFSFLLLIAGCKSFFWVLKSILYLCLFLFYISWISFSFYLPFNITFLFIIIKMIKF